MQKNTKKKNRTHYCQINKFALGLKPARDRDGAVYHHSPTLLR